jgi:hypothetical protein
VNIRNSEVPVLFEVGEGLYFFKRDNCRQPHKGSESHSAKGPMGSKKPQCIELVLGWLGRQACSPGIPWLGQHSFSGAKREG